MNPQVNNPMRSQGQTAPYDQQIQSNPYNTFDLQSSQAPTCNRYPPIGSNYANVQNGLSSKSSGPASKQSIPQVQSNTVPLTSHIINNQMTQNFSAMQLQNQNPTALKSSGYSPKFSNNIGPPSSQAFPTPGQQSWQQPVHPGIRGNVNQSDNRGIQQSSNTIPSQPSSTNTSTNYPSTNLPSDRLPLNSHPGLMANSDYSTNVPPGSGASVGYEYAVQPNYNSNMSHLPASNAPMSYSAHAPMSNFSNASYHHHPNAVGYSSNSTEHYPSSNVPAFPNVSESYASNAPISFASNVSASSAPAAYNTSTSTSTFSNAPQSYTSSNFSSSNANYGSHLNQPTHMAYPPSNTAQYPQTYPTNVQQDNRPSHDQQPMNNLPSSDANQPQPAGRVPPAYTNGTRVQHGEDQPNYGRYPPSMGTQGVGYPPSAAASQYGGHLAESSYTTQSRSGSISQASTQNRRLDPDNMPSPIQVIDDDRKLRSCSFSTSQRGVLPPLVTTHFTVIDEGNCSPRFIRSAIYNVPTTADALKQTQVPFALSVSPFAQLQENERPPPIVHPGEDGPVRCHRCRAYVSPFMQFIDAGRRFQCLLCKTTSEVPVHYFTHLDHMGQRVDKLERAELCLGSYEFIVNKDYCKEGKFPNVPAFIFLIDVSYNSIRSGMVRLLCENMKYILSKLPREGDMQESNMKVGFITYSTGIHFYNINKNLAQPQMLMVSDVQDMFMPLLDGFLVHPSESAHVIDSLMQQIPTMFAETRETETVLGPAIQAGLEALKAAECAGKLFVFHSSLPLAEAPGKLKNRDDRKLLGTEKEKTILMPQTPFYNNLGQECVKAGCSVDLFLFPNAYIDIATIGQVCRLTGGQLFKYTYFQADIDGERFIKELQKQIEKPIAFDAVLRVRTSTGIRPTDFLGSFFMSNTTDVELASITSDTSLSVEIKYDDKLCEEEGVCVQVATLYTSCSGQRRLRVHNLALNTCVQMADLFRSCELDAILNFFLKDGVRRINEESPRHVRDYLVNRSAQVLACYRRNCAQASSAGQLILPECMKLLPLYINCLIKCDALAGGQEMTTDDRSFIMLAALSMNVDSSASYLYPRLLPMLDAKPNLETVELPTALRCSFERLKDDSVYILENGINLFLWIGLNADPDWIQDVFGVPTVATIDSNQTHLIPRNNLLSEYVRKVLDKIQSERHRNMKLHVVRQGDKLELLFRQLLVEDRTTEGSASYVDFLCHLHKEIRTLLS